MNKYVKNIFFWVLLPAYFLILPAASSAAEADPLSDARLQLKAGQASQALLTLQAFLVKNPAQPYRHQADFVIGKALSAQGRHQEALSYFQEAAQAPSPAKDYILFYLAQGYEALEQRPAAQKTLVELLQAYPAGPLATQARINLAKLYQAEGDCAQAQKFYDAASASSLEARFLEGECLKSREPAAALKIFRALYVQYPASLWAQKAYSAAEDLRMPIILGDKESFSRAQALMDSGHYNTATGEWSRYLQRFPQSNRRWQARFQLGQAQFKSRRYSAALDTFREVVKRGPLSLRGESLFWLGWAALRTSQEKTYQESFARLFQQYPQNPQMGRALYIWGRDLEESGETAKAQEAYQQLLQKKYNPQLAEEAFWRQGWVYYKNGQYQQAAASWRELLRIYPDCPSAPQAQYWLGRVYEQEGNPLLAKTTYQELAQKDAAGYYGWRAGERWINLIDKNSPEAKLVSTTTDNGIFGFAAAGTQETLSKEVSAAGQPSLPAIDTQFLARQDELMALDLEAAAVSELHTLARTLTSESPAWKEVISRFYRMDAPEKAVYWAKKLWRQGQVSLLQQNPQFLYPRVYWPQITAGAKKTGLDPYLILAVMREESNFGPQVVSSAGAHGLMQLIHDTAQKVARKENMTYNPQDIYRPELNVTLGSHYLADMIQEMGSVPWALAAYNAGPHRVKAWRAYEGKNQEESFEDIPFDETRNYVKRVLNSYRIYKALYEKEPGVTDSSWAVMP